MASLKERCHRLEALERHRDSQRAKLDELDKKKRQLEQEIASLQVVLDTLDSQIDELESGIVADQNVESLPPAQQQPARQRNEEGQNSHEDSAAAASRNQQNPSLSSQVVLSASPLQHSTMSMRLPEENLTDPTTPKQQQQQQQRMMNNSAEASQIIEDDDEHDKETHQNNLRMNNPYAKPGARTSSSASITSNTSSLQIVTVAASRKKRPRVSEESAIHNNEAATTGSASTTSASAPTGTLDAYFEPKYQPVVAPTAAAAPPPSPESMARANSNNNHHPPQHPVNAEFSRNDFPWSRQVLDLLRNTFRIQNFREHQQEVINCTLKGDDVFVLMRTGGGKSLTYQLPALLEGRPPNGHPGKVTFVISPLLSLIKDQEDQMNKFAPGSALSFTSGLAGGRSEHTRRWDLVRDPSQGVCLVLVTPEMVFKSGKLKSEIQKLYNEDRLGRFVADEAHCCSNWGHDFRPDYTKLGLLRENFPRIPIIAVTATASDRVRQDVCDILHMSHNVRFFRSTANRPNLMYEVRVKQTSGTAVLDDIAAFIKGEFSKKAGIIYTLSKKDADTVADELCERGIVARSYHSDVSAARKDQIHQSWMSNETQVVVATIAFGLGINKPDVRFVFHHTISKTLEAYYQESGRAGRDGNPAKCLLYYNPKDVPRMAKMVHQDSLGKLDAFWYMIRYAQASLSDQGCRAMILKTMGEGNTEMDASIEAEYRRQEQGAPGSSAERRDVGKHAKTVTQLLRDKVQFGENVTQAQLVKEWRQKPGMAPQCVKENPPGKDLNAEECERVIVGLLVEGIFSLKFQWTAYDCVPYVQLGEFAYKMLNSPDPKVVMAFPKREKTTRKSTTLGESTKSRARKSIPGEGGWHETKAKAAPKKAKKATTKVSRKKKQPLASKGKNASKKSESNQSRTSIIELSSSDEDELFVAPPVTRRKAASKESHSNAALKDDLMDDSPESSDAEYEFQE